MPKWRPRTMAAKKTAATRRMRTLKLNRKLGLLGCLLGDILKIDGEDSPVSILSYSWSSLSEQEVSLWVYCICLFIFYGIKDRWMRAKWWMQMHEPIVSFKEQRVRYCTFVTNPSLRYPAQRCSLLFRYLPARSFTCVLYCSAIVSTYATRT